MLKRKKADSVDRINFFKGSDLLTFFLALTASAYGFLLVYSATFKLIPDGGLLSDDIKSMILSLSLGIVFAVVISTIDYEIISKLWPFIAAGCVLLMLYTMVKGVAPNQREDAKSWIKIGTMTFQSSEIVKVGFIITFSYHLDMVKNKLNDITQILLLCLHGLIPIMLVVLTGDAGSALIFLIIFAGMMFMANVNILYFIAGGAAMVIGMLTLWKFDLIGAIHKQRVLGLFFPEDYPAVMYQQNNAKVAMGSGGWFGKGFLKGDYTQSNMVPENQNDMILSVAGEEFGFIGAILVILILIVLIIRIFVNGFKARDNVGFMMCCGVAIMLLAQTFVNIAMELSLLPCIGITLPFFSAGGSSSLSVYMAIGLVLSIYRYSQTPDDMMFYTKR